MEEIIKETAQTLNDMHETVDAASMGLWRIELFEGEKPRMKASEKMMELLGIEGQSLTHEEIYEAWHSRICPGALLSVNESVGKMISGKRDENTYRWCHPTLGERYVRCGGKAHEVPGKGHVLLGYHYDVTEQVKADQEQSLIISSLADTFLCLFYIDVPNNTYTSYSNNAKSVAQYIPVTGALDKSFENFHTYLAKPEYVDRIRKFTDLSTLNSRLEFRKSISTQFLGTTGIWCDVSFIVCDRKQDGTVNHMIMAVRDITDQKLEEEKRMRELKANIEENKSKTMMLQNMSHEIRTPLNAMFGFSQLLSLPDGSVSEEDKSSYFNYIYNSYNMLSMLIDDVLDVADAEHGNFRVQMEDVCVNEVCRTAIQMTEVRRPAHVNMYFTTDVDDSLIITSDGRRIQQVLINYLTNACKHTVKGEIHLHLSDTETPGRLTFSVTDTGEGIPADKAKDVFQRFKKLNDRVQGSGLGLNICSVIAEKLNGEVSLDTSYTNGARFLFVL